MRIDRVGLNKKYKVSTEYPSLSIILLISDLILILKMRHPHRRSLKRRAPLMISLPRRVPNNPRPIKRSAPLINNSHLTIKFPKTKFNDKQQEQQTKYYYHELEHALFVEE